MAGTPDDLLTTKQAAEELGLDESSVRRLVRDGVLPAFKPSPRITLIKRSDLSKASNRPKVGNPNFQPKPKRRRSK